MPRPIRQQIVDTPALPQTPRPAALEPAAAPVSTFVTPQDSELNALAKGLGAMHAPLAALQADNDRRAQHDAILSMQAAAERTPDPKTADGAELVAGNIPPAYRRDAMEAYRKGIGERLGVDASQAFLNQYAQDRLKADFNIDQFAAKFRSENLNGLTDPHLALGAAKHIDAAIAQARGDQRTVLEARAAQTRMANLSAQLSAIDPDADPYRRLLDFEAAAKDHVAAGGTRAEAATAMMDQMTALSSTLHGRPDLFDVFDQEVPGLGKKLSDLVPGLKTKAADERFQADKMLKHHLHEITTEARGDQLVHIDELIANGTALRMGDADFSTYLKQFMATDGTGALSAEGYHAKMSAFLAAKAQDQDKATTAQLLAAGLGNMVPKEKATKVLTDAVDRTGAWAHIAQSLKDPTVDPSPGINAIIAAHSATKVSFPEERLKALIDSVKQEVPQPNGAPSPQFLLAARLYATLERTSNPVLNAYFDDKTRGIFSMFNRQTVEGQVGVNTAYHQVLKVNDPDNVKAADARMADPSVVAQVNKEVHSAMRGWVGAEGTAGIARWFPIGIPFVDIVNTPEFGNLEAATHRAVREYKLANPDATTDDMVAYAGQWSKANAFYEPVSGRFLQVPPDYNNPDTREAVGNYIKLIKQNNPNVDVRLSPSGNGFYDLMFYRGTTPEKAADGVTLDSMLALQRAQKNFTPAELQSLGVVRRKIEDGSATFEDLKGAELAISKARSFGLWSNENQRKADALAVQAAEAQTSTALDRELAPAKVTALHRAEFSASSAVKPQGSAVTTDVASRFHAEGNLSGALAAMGEGVRLAAYKDAAGHLTIGIGYNLSANADTVDADFRKAGIPPDSLDELKAGTRRLTVEQAMRLYSAVKPRYEAIAKGAIDARYPGEWPKLGDNVRAVLTDIAYQTGNVAQFKDGLERLRKGDLSGSGLEVQFKNKASQQYQTDVRRHTLRTSMLSSTTNFQGLLSHAAQQPANALQRSQLVGGSGGRP